LPEIDHSGLAITFVATSYPIPGVSTGGTFVQQFVWAMARQGNECCVISPTSIFKRRRGPLPPRQAVENAGGQRRVSVHRPRYLSFSSVSLGWFHTARWTSLAFNKAVVKADSGIQRRADVYYGHFLYPAGSAASRLTSVRGTPSVVGVGEGTFWTVAPFGWGRARVDLAYASGFLAVASHIRNGLIGRLGVLPSSILVEPNGVDLDKFTPIPRQEARAKLGLDQGGFLIAFVGTFDHLKGGRELIEAARELDVGLLLLGSGPVNFESSQVVFKGQVPHDDVRYWLGAADIFVLPTQEEGSCNAVIEAMACGLPIVTADGEYMDDIVDDEVALRVDPKDVTAIRAAISALMNDADGRSRMSKACFSRAKKFDINDRAARVTTWMNNLVRSYGP